MAKRNVEPVTPYYRVCWIGGSDAPDGKKVCRAAVLDTALIFAQKVSKTNSRVAVWECGEESRIRAFGVKGATRWPIECTTCDGHGKTYEPGMFGTMPRTCDKCLGFGVVPEE